MATQSHLSPDGGWIQYDDSTNQGYLDPNGGWIQIVGVGGGPSGLIKVYISSAWVQKPIKVWNGSSWVTKPLKFWDGSAWITTT